jgi:hypothetical protein
MVKALQVADSLVERGLGLNQVRHIQILYQKPGPIKPESATGFALLNGLVV